MKRIAILFCVLALLLAACSQPSTPETTQAPSGTDAAQTAASSELPAEPAQTEPLVTEPSVTEPGYSAGGSPTAGGVVVYTDPSAYRPYSGQEAKYTRLREGPLDHFEPSDDYGAVYPYVAARLYGSVEDGQSWEAGSLCGLVDASGRILTDGIYTGVKPLSVYDYESESETILPYWVLTAVDSAELVTEIYEGGSYTWIDGETRCGLISMDGSFMLPLEYRGISVLGDGFLCSRDWDGVSYEAYDGAGRLLFTGEDLVRGSGYPSATVVAGGEGLYLVELYGEEIDSQSWFCDARGQRVLGPYAEADAFHDGLACVSLDGSWYGYIDKTGAWILEPQFTEFASFRDGRAIQSTGYNSRCIIDTAGNILFTAEPGAWVYRVPCGFRMDGTNYETSLYDRDLNLLLRGYSIGCQDRDTFFADLDDGIRLFRLDGTELYAPDIYSFSPGMTVLDGEAVEGYLSSQWTEEGLRYFFVPRDLSALLEINTNGAPGPGNYVQLIYNTTDQCTGEKWTLSWDADAWQAVNEAGEIRRIPLRASGSVLLGDRIMAVTDRACVYVDWEGKLLFSYPLNDGD